MGYTADQIDFIAAFIAKHDAWYLIPLESLGSRQNIRLYPSGQKANRGGGFEQYREAWNLLKNEAQAGPVDAATEATLIHVAAGV